MAYTSAPGCRQNNKKFICSMLASDLRSIPRLVDSHHKLRKVVQERKIWLGEPASAEPSGKRIKVTPATLDYSEWLHAHFLKLPFNEKKTRKPPPRGVTVLNRWYRTDYHTLHRNRPHPDWPDLLDYPGYEDVPARMIWFGGKQKRLLREDLK